MVSNKKAKQTLAIVSGWDQYRAINKRLNNNVVVSLDANGWLFVFSKKVKGDRECNFISILRYPECNTALEKYSH